MAGKVRRLLHEVDQAVEAERAPATKTPSTMQQGEEISLLVTGQSILQDRVAPVISIPEYERLIARFKVEFPCEILSDATTPGRSYLRKLNHQKVLKSFEWVSWTSIISKSQEDELSTKIRKTPTNEQAAIISSLWDQEVQWGNNEQNPSPYHVQNVFTVRRHAMAMLDICHIKYLKELDTAMMTEYTRTYDSKSSLRAPNLHETIHADKEIFSKIFSHAREPDMDVDKALYAALEIRRSVPIFMAPKPYVQMDQQKGSFKQSNNASSSKGEKRKVEEESKGGGKGKAQRSEKERSLEQKVDKSKWSTESFNGKQVCFRFNTSGMGCSQKNCRFGHFCPIRVGNGKPCGKNHPAYKHESANGIHK